MAVTSLFLRGSIKPPEWIFAKTSSLGRGDVSFLLEIP
jgi:hypothetical protein